MSTRNSHERECRILTGSSRHAKVNPPPPPTSGRAVALLLLEVFAFAYLQANSLQGSGSVFKVFLLEIHLR